LTDRAATFSFFAWFFLLHFRPTFIEQIGKIFLGFPIRPGEQKEKEFELNFPKQIAMLQPSMKASQVLHELIQNHSSNEMQYIDFVMFGSILKLVELLWRAEKTIRWKLVENSSRID
jgi:hypothetical protein